MGERVKLMNEYTIDWPLWRLGGPAKPEDIPVSESLRVALLAWARVFNTHYDGETGAWDDSEVAERHAAEGYRLQRELSRQLGSGHEVVLDLWEVPH